MTYHFWFPWKKGQTVYSVSDYELLREALHLFIELASYIWSWVRDRRESFFLNQMNCNFVKKSLFS